MKIAFVNQPIDTILPPFQSSVGACTYGVACSLPKSCEVLVYGAKDRHKDSPSDFWKEHVHFRFLPLPLSDRLASKARNEYSKLFPINSPASSSNWLFRGFGLHVAKDLQRQACDVIHIQHCSQYAPVIHELNPKSKIVLQLHAEWFSQNEPEVLEQRLRHVDLITTVSDHITRKTRGQVFAIATCCETAYNGIDAREFAREKDCSSALPRKEKRILYAGALSPHKGVHILLNAFSIVTKRHPDVRLDIVGLQGSYPLAECFDLKDRELIRSVSPFYTRHRMSRLKAQLSLASPDQGTYRSYLRGLLSAEEGAKVAFLGFVPRPALLDLYYNADVFVFPPIWDEGFGIPPVEAMAAGVPVVATKSGAISETVRDGKTGFLVNKNDPRALAEAILTLLTNDNLRQTMGKASRKWAHEQFTWDRAAVKMHARYLSLCTESRFRDATASQSTGFVSSAKGETQPQL